MNYNQKVVVKKKKRILLLADWHRASTGFGTVTKNILPHIMSHYGDDLMIFFVAINYFGEPYEEGNMTVVSARNFFTPEMQDGTMAEPDPLGTHSFLMKLLADELGFDLAFIIYDIGLIKKMIPTMKEFKLYRQKEKKKNFKTVIYSPVDHDLTKDDIEGLDFVDTIITYNEYSRNQVIRHKTLKATKVKVIPHGSNQIDFHPMDETVVSVFRKTYFGLGKDSDNKIIYSNINRNQPRKAISDTILAFIQAKESWPKEGVLAGKKPFLYLHMLDKDPLMFGYDLKIIFSQTDLIEGEDYMIAPQEYFTSENGADISILRGIYNASDICITTSLGEGWGLGVTESMACRTPVIVPCHTSFVEISGGNGNRAHVVEYMVPFISPFDHRIRNQVDIDEFANMMIEAAEKRVEGSDMQMIEAAEKYVKSLSWRNISKQFVDCFDDLM